MKYILTLFFVLMAGQCFAQNTIAATNTVLIRGDTLAEGQVYWATNPITIADSTSQHRLLAYTLGGGTYASVVNNFRVVARVAKAGVYSDTITLGTLSTVGNAATTIATKTTMELQNEWMPTLSGTDSTVVWYLRKAGGFEVQYGLKAYASHAGGQDVILALDIPEVE